MKKSELKRLNALTQFASGTLKVRAKRKKEISPRNQPERALRAEVIKWLRKKGFYFKRLENGVWGSIGRGVPDLLFFAYKKFYFLELKAKSGYLSLDQKEFKAFCEDAGVNHIVARSVGEIERVICEGR